MPEAALKELSCRRAEERIVFRVNRHVGKSRSHLHGGAKLVEPATDEVLGVIIRERLEDLNN